MAIKIKLPEPLFLSPEDLAERWECQESYVLHLADIGELPTADMHAARYSSRYTIFVAYDDKPGLGPILKNSAVKSHYANSAPPSEMDLMEDVSSSFTPDPIQAVNQAATKNLDSRTLVFLFSDILSFEAEHADEAISLETESTADSTATLDEFPGRLPPTWIGKEAIKIAFNIERSEQRHPSAKEIIKALRHVAEHHKGGEDGRLRVKNGSPSVEWFTTKQSWKEFSESACSIALKKWNSSRQ